MGSHQGPLASPPWLGALWAGLWSQHTPRTSMFPHEPGPAGTSHREAGGAPSLSARPELSNKSGETLTGQLEDRREQDGYVNTPWPPAPLGMFHTQTCLGLDTAVTGSLPSEACRLGEIGRHEGVLYPRKHP